MVLWSIRLAGVVHPNSQTDQGIESQARCNLEFAIPPADRKQLTASGQKQKEQDSQNREGLTHMKHQPVCKREIVMSRAGGEWPSDHANEYDERRNCEQGPAWQRCTDRAQHGPQQLNQHSKLEEGVDDQHNQEDLEVGGGVEMLCGKHRSVAEQTPSKIEREYRECAVYTPKHEQSNDCSRCSVSCQPENIIQRHRLPHAKVPRQRSLILLQQQPRHCSSTIDGFPVNCDGRWLGDFGRCRRHHNDGTRNGSSGRCRRHHDNGAGGGNFGRCRRHHDNGAGGGNFGRCRRHHDNGAGGGDFGCCRRHYDDGAGGGDFGRCRRHYDDGARHQQAGARKQ